MGVNEKTKSASKMGKGRRGALIPLNSLHVLSSLSMCVGACLGDRVGEWVCSAHRGGNMGHARAELRTSSCSVLKKSTKNKEKETGLQPK